MIPLSIWSELPYLSIRLYTNAEWDKLPQVILTADVDWDQTINDHKLEDGEEWFDTMQDIPEFDPDPLFDDVGDYKLALQSCNRNFMPSEVFPISIPNLRHFARCV